MHTDTVCFFCYLIYGIAFLNFAMCSVNFYTLSKMHQFRNGIAQNYKDQF